MIQRLVSHEHDITLFSKRFAHSLKAEVTGLDTKTGLLLLEVGSAGQDLKHYLRNGHFSFDIEARITPEGHEKEVHSFDRIPAEVHKKDADTYLIRCQLPESVFVTESRGALRIPFILGMNARVSISAYDAELTIEARVRNFSVGGCLADMSIEDSLSLYVGQTVPDLAITFPNGEYLFSKGRVRHIRPFGSLGRAAVGIQFTDVSSTMSKEIFQYISECEREAASRSGLKENVVPSELFIAKRTGAAATSTSKSEKSKMSRQPAMVPEVLRVAQQLKVIMMFIKNRDIFSEGALFECGDTLIDGVKNNRKQLLYALAFMRGQPEWVRHAVQLSGVLADMLIARDPHSRLIREAVIGALIHNMGKPLLIGKQIPSLKVNMNPGQRAFLKRHPDALLKKLTALNWEPGKTCRDIIENANERLDGSGYPAGKVASQLSDQARLVSV
ncbi:HD domain-containing phosphohydrolase, partial [Marinobacter alexandrii]|uniref:HD domain-containing phosphohydrolase n=1 Tax=Marinobacter alexandrii TaxID=2570351 RepID=UPI0032975D27